MSCSTIATKRCRCPGMYLTNKPRMAGNQERKLIRFDPISSRLSLIDTSVGCKYLCCSQHAGQRRKRRRNSIGCVAVIAAWDDCDALAPNLKYGKLGD